MYAGTIFTRLIHCLRDQSWLCVYCHIREFNTTIHTQSWLIPIIAWCHQICSLATNTLFINSNWTFESTAIRVRHAWTFLLEIELVKSSVQDWHLLLDEIEVHNVLCLKAEFLMHNVVSNKDGTFYTGMMYPTHTSAGRYFLNWIACLLTVRPMFKQEFPRFLVTSRIAWVEFQMWSGQCK